MLRHGSVGALTLNKASFQSLASASRAPAVAPSVRAPAAAMTVRSPAVVRPVASVYEIAVPSPTEGVRGVWMPYMQYPVMVDNNNGSYQPLPQIGTGTINGESMVLWDLTAVYGPPRMAPGGAIGGVLVLSTSAPRAFYQR